MRAPYPAIYRPRVPLTAPTSTRPRRVLATVTAAQVVNVASTTIVAVALPDLGAELGASPTELQWVVDAFVLVFASLLIAGGVAGDRYGRRRALLTGLVVFAVGSLWCAVAPSIEWLLAGRVVQALGPPLTLPASLAIVTATFTEPRARARAIGVWGAGSGRRPRHRAAAGRRARRRPWLAVGLRHQRARLRGARRARAGRRPARPPGPAGRSLRRGGGGAAHRGGRAPRLRPHRGP
jgi:hypothetical protein